MKWFMNWKTSAKLVTSFLVVAAIVGFVGLFSVYNLHTMNENSKQMYTNNVMSIQTLSDTQDNFLNMRVTIRDISLTPAKADKDRLVAESETYKKEMIQQLNEYRPLATTPAEQIELKNTDAFIASYIAMYATAIDMAYKQDTTEYLLFLKNSLSPEGSKLRDSIDKLLDINVKLADEANDESLNTYNDARNITIVISIIAIIVSILLGYTISRFISNPLNKIVTLVRKVAEGDLRQEADIHSKDEVGQLAENINEMIRNLRSLIGGISMSSQSVAAASEQISASTQEIASTSTTQAESAQSISAMFKELTIAITSAAQSAEEASELSDDTVQTANAGESVVRASAAGMQAVNESMSRLEQDSRKIGAIIEVIDDIADQTNLLALNAAIEAARAGDQGRGFSVVADEVRKLAERSSEATKEITSIIIAMQDNTKQSVAAVLDSAAQSEEMKEAFRNIIKTVDHSSNKVSEIAAACEEESAQAASVMRSVELIAASSQEAAAASEETAATCQSLANLADELNVSVAKFKI